MSELERALAPLRDGPVPLATSTERELERERLLPRVRSEVQALPERLRRRRRQRLILRGGALGAGAALLAGLALALGASPFHDSEGLALRIEALGAAPVTWRDDGSSSKTFAGAVRLPARGVLSSGEVSAARVTTASGVRIELAERTEVDLGSLDGQSRSTALRLVSGAVECRVPPLAPGEQFSVITRGAEVIVHGTVFSVRRSSGDGEPCVRVSEGRVTVRHATGSAELDPGDSYGCAESKPSAASEARNAESPSRADAPRAPETAATPERSRPPRSERRTEINKESRTGTLEKENLLLSRALSAERAERRELARSLFSELLQRYPGSPLSPEARAGLERCGKPR